MQLRISTALLALVSFCLAQAPSPGVHPVSKRRYAQVMGAAAADWLVRPERESEEHPDEALDALKIAPGSTLADIGAGVGYFTWRMADRTGPAGLVYAEDIQPEMIRLLNKNIAERKLTNVRPILGTYDDPKLPKNTVDLILLVDVYHEFSDPVKMVDAMHESLKSNGRLVLLEYRAEDPNVPIRPEHKMTVKQVRTELEPQGFRFEQTIETLPWQHILIFRAVK